MKRIFTLFYSVNDFENEKSEFYDVDALLGNNLNGFDDVYQLLSQTEVEPDKEIVNNVINFSRSF